MPARRAAVAAVATAVLLGAGCAQSPPAAAPPAPSPPAGPPAASSAPAAETYRLPGDAAGSRFEGIGYDAGTGTFYVSEVTGGEIHRGRVDAAEATEWLPGDGADGRFTARGIVVDGDGRVYVAGGPNGIDHPGAPDLWVYDRNGALLAALDTGVDRAFLNDVALGPDGAAYFTNSTAPQIFKVARSGTGWTVTTWADATATIPTQEGFNLGGIVTTGDGRALLVAQGNVGRLWRFDLGSAAAGEVAVTGANLKDADGLILQGDRLTAVRNFSKMITTVRLGDGGTTATLLAEQASPPDRVLTTAKVAGDRLLVVDSKFDENPPRPPYEVLSLPLP